MKSYYQAKHFLGAMENFLHLEMQEEKHFSFLLLDIMEGRCLIENSQGFSELSVARQEQEIFVKAT